MFTTRPTPPRLLLLPLILVAAACFLRAAVAWAGGGTLPTFVTFYPAVLLAAWLGGLLPGLLATLLALLAALFLVSPGGALPQLSRGDVIGLLLFSLVNICISFICDRNRLMRLRMGELVEKRTKELEDSRQSALAALEEALQARQSVERAGQDLRTNEARYRSLFTNMLNGFAHCRMIFDHAGQPTDFVYLDANPAFEKLTHLKDVVGKRVTELIPGIRETDPKLFELYGRVALTGEPERVELYLDALKTWFEVSVYCPAREHFVAVFDVISARKQAELRLQAEQAALRGILNATSESVLLFAPDGTILMANKTAAQRVGKRWDELIGKTFHDFFDPALAESRLARLKETIQSQRPVEFEDRRDETVVHHWFYPILEALGQVTGVAAFSQDLTEQRRAETALHQREAQFRAILENAPDAVFIATPQGRYTYANREASTLLGYTNEELLSMGIPDLTPPSEVALAQQALGRLFAERHLRIELSLKRKDGTLVPVELSGTVLPDGSAYGCCRDITQRKRSEEERLRLVTALEQAAESIVITDLDGSILYANPAFERITGYSLQEAVGQNPRVLKSGKHDPAYYRQMWETLSRGEVWHGHFVNRRKDGTLYEEEATISPVRDPAGKVVNYIAIKLDVTRELQLESQLRQAQKLEAIGQLAGGVAHDFNNILAAILMQLGLLQMSASLDPETDQALRELEAEARRAASLTRQLLMFSRRSVLDVKPLDLYVVVTGVLKMLGRLIGEDIRLVLDSRPSSLPPVAADAGMLEQVLMNLVVNARDAMPKGGTITIATTVETITHQPDTANRNCQPGRFVCLTVSDTGAGMNKETLERIFEPFFTTKAPGKGTGLGLATVHGIVAQHKGWVDVESEPDKGTTFRVFLPAQAQAAKPAAIPAPSAPPPHGSEGILVVEDEPGVRRIVARTLTALGYRVHEAENGQQAVLLWQQHAAQVDLLLTDMVMPEGMTGLELAEQLRKLKPTLKVLISSGYSSEIVQAGGIKQSGISYLPKPYELKQLAETVRACLKPRS